MRRPILPVARRRGLNAAPPPPPPSFRQQTTAPPPPALCASQPPSPEPHPALLLPAHPPALTSPRRSLPTPSPPQTAERAAGRNAAWLKLVRRSGTAQDRVAASVVQVQGNVLGNLRALDTLLDLTDSARSAGGKRGAGQALDALRELFSDWCGPSRWALSAPRAPGPASRAAMRRRTSALLTAALPLSNLLSCRLLPDRKLRSFDQQPLASLASDAPSVRAERLGYYFLEDAIKTRYERFVTVRLGVRFSPMTEHMSLHALNIAVAVFPESLLQL